MAKLNTLLKQNNNDVYTFSVLNGIDVTNVLADNVSTYTATEDCFAVSQSTTGGALKIDNVIVSQSYGSDSYQVHGAFVKKGQVVTGIRSPRITIYGIKR